MRTPSKAHAFIALAVGFLGAGSTFAQAPPVVEGNVAGAQFGWSVAPAGDVNKDGLMDVLVGAPTEPYGGERLGAVHVLLGDSSGLSSSPYLTIRGPKDGSLFGWCVRLAGDVNDDGLVDLLVGAPGFSDGEPGEGAAFLHLGESGGFSATSSWSFEGGQPGARLGWAVAGGGLINNDEHADVALGAPGWRVMGSEVGMVIAFTGIPGSVGLGGSAWKVVGDHDGDRFGAVVAFRPKLAVYTTTMLTDLLVSAPTADLHANDDGVVHFFPATLGGLSQVPTWSAAGPTSDAFFGTSLATDGDLDLDGYADLVVGSWASVAGDGAAGNITIFKGASSGFSSNGVVLTSTSDEDALGHDVAAIGDFDKDGWPDLIVGAKLSDGPTSPPIDEQGEVLVLLGSPAGFSLNASISASSGSTDAQLGHAVVGVGDVNGDGRSDAVAGAPWHSNGERHEGSVRLITSAK